MAEFRYSSATRDGKRVDGTREADTRDDVAQYLHEQGLVVISIDEKIGLDWAKISSIQIGGVPLRERVIFAKQLSTMLGAGLPILQALDILVQQTKNQSLKAKLLKAYKKVEAGSSLSEAFGQDKSIFSEIQINLLAAGEKGGKLSEMMLQIANDLEKSKQLRSKIVGAMIYPVIIFFVLIAVMVLMLVFMIPSVKDLYKDMGKENDLPWVTQSLVSLSEFVSNPFGMISIIVVVLFVAIALRYYYSTPNGHRAIDRLFLKLPVFGNLNVKIQITQFNRLLAMLLTSGVPIVDALNSVANAMTNIIFVDAIKMTASEVLKGSSISVPLSKTEVFPLVMVKMLATGEETGKLDAVTLDMANFYGEEVEEITSNLTKLMEPFILLLVGGLVGFMAVAIYLPLYTIGQATQ